MTSTTQSIFHKGDKRVNFSSSVLIEPTCSQNHSSQPKALPRIPLEEMNLYLMFIMQPLAAISIRLRFSMVSYIRSQVVHNRGHGFSKRLTLQGLACIRLSSLPASCPSRQPSDQGLPQTTTGEEWSSLLHHLLLPSTT